MTWPDASDIVLTMTLTMTTNDWPDDCPISSMKQTLTWLTVEIDGIVWLTYCCYWPGNDDDVTVKEIIENWWLLVLLVMTRSIEENIWWHWPVLTIVVVMTDHYQSDDQWWWRWPCPSIPSIEGSDPVLPVLMRYSNLVFIAKFDPNRSVCDPGSWLTIDDDDDIGQWNRELVMKAYCWWWPR